MTRGRAHRDKHRGGLADRDVVPDVSLRQEEAECDGNCRGEKLDEPGPQAAFAAQDAGELVAPAFRAISASTREPELGVANLEQLTASAEPVQPELGLGPAGDGSLRACR